MPVMRYREALNQALREEMEADEKVFVMGEDIGVFQGAFKVTAGLLDEFGEKRVRDTPISENTIVGMGVGSAMIGLRPVVEPEDDVAVVAGVVGKVRARDGHGRVRVVRQHGERARRVEADALDGVWVDAGLGHDLAHALADAGPDVGR